MNLPDLTRFNEYTTTIFQDGLLGFLINTVIVITVAYVFWFALKRYINRFPITKTLDEAKINFILKTIKTLLISLSSFAIATKITPLNNLALSLLASSGVMVIVIGFAAQETVANLISGVFISFFRPFTINDQVHIAEKNISGFVEDITMRHTVIRTFENNRVVIPNSIINKSIIENRDLRDHRACRFLLMSIAYSADLDKARNIMINEAENHPLLIDTRTKKEIKDGLPWFKVILYQLSASSVDLRITLWTKTNADAFAVMNDLRESIKKRFDAEGIEIPFTTHSVYIKNTP